MDDQRVESDGGTPLVEYPVTERVTIVGAQPAGAMVAEADEDASDEAGAEVPGSEPCEVGEGGSGTTDVGGVPAEPAPLQAPLEASTGPGAPSAGSRDTDSDRSAGLPPGGVPVVPDLPHWTDPPTGQVPAVLDRGGNDEADPWSTALGGGPMWREHPHEWEDMSFEPALLGDEETQLGAMGTQERFDLAWDGEEDPEPDPKAGSGLPGSRPGAGPGTTPSRDSTSPLGDGAAAMGTAPPGSPVSGTAPSGSPASGTAPSGSPASDVAQSSAAATGSAPPGSPASGTAPSGSPGRRSVRRRRSESSGRAHPKSERQRPVAAGQEREARNVPLAVGVGVGFAAVGLVCLKLGPLAMASLVTVVVVVAAAEAYGAVRRAGYRPATLLGLVATVAVVVAAYAKGLSALPLVTVIVVLATMLWYLFRVGKGSPLQGMGVTVLVFGWVGLLGSYGGLLVAPSLFPDRHGVAFIFGAIAAVVAADVGALAFGTWLGRRPLAPTVSPGKTWEGAIGGGIVAIVVSTFLVGHVHPWTPASAAVLGVLAAVLGPLGDLCESLVKRELGIKDMGSVLPGHGGILDRVDGLLFLLPATFYLVRALHLG